MTLPITALFVAVFALIQVPITFAVGFRRLKTGIRFLDGGDDLLLRRMRAHGNYTETVPIVLLAMAGAEISGTPVWLLWAGGLILLAGRLLHYAILVRKGWGPTRAVGMSLTFVAMISFPICILLAQAGLWA